MKFYHVFATRFSRNDQRRLYSGWVGFFVVVWCLFIAFNLRHLTFINFSVCTVYGIKSVSVINKTSNRELSYVRTKEAMLRCNTFNQRAKTCEINGDVRINGTSSTIFVFRPHVENISWTIKPYPRNGDKSAMSRVTSFTIKSVPKQPETKTMPRCTQTHNVPAIVFSGGGYSGNNFHAFSEVIIPLYATSNEFKRQVLFLVANKHTKFTKKFQLVLDNLSRYAIVDIDHDQEVHCFPSMIVGLKKEAKELYTKSMKDFKRFLRSSYSLERSRPIKLTKGVKTRPRLLIVPRQRTRAFTNVKDVVNLAHALGFEVLVEEMSADLTQVARVVNSCDVMMGVHGAGLTNMVFMPENGVLIQVVPLGKMDWVVKSSFGTPSKEMGLKYLEYKISEHESSLIEDYPLNHSVFVDPVSVGRKGWSAFKSIYLDKQNVTIDVVRFKTVLVNALELLR